MSLQSYGKLPKLDTAFAKTTYAPGYTSDTHSGGVQNYPVEEQIDAFARLYKLWILEYANRLAEMPNSGFAVLTLLNAYPEMVAQLHGIHVSKPELFRAGILMIFPEIRGEYEDDICDHLYAYLRSGLAHMGLTSFNIILNGDIPVPIQPGTLRGALAIIINPNEWLKRIEAHFESYINTLKNVDEIDFRDQFSARMKRPF